MQKCHNIGSKIKAVDDSLVFNNSQIKLCPYCSSIVDGTKMICPNCGSSLLKIKSQKINQEKQKIESKRKDTKAFFLGLFFGIFGIIIVALLKKKNYCRQAWKGFLLSTIIFIIPLLTISLILLGI